MKNRHSLSRDALCLVIFVIMSTFGAYAHALTALSDTDMSAVEGEGLAFALEGFSFQMAPTSYIELTGTRPNAAALAKGWKLGNVRYYGLSLTGATGGLSWFGGACTQTADGLGCPMGSGTITDLASVYDPYVLRVFQYPGYDYQASYRNQSTNPGVPSTYQPTILEFIGPSTSDAFHWSFWGALGIGDGTVLGWSTSTAGVASNPDGSIAGCLNALAATNHGYCGLQSQSIIFGRPIAYTGTLNNQVGTGTALPSRLRMFLTQNNADPTLGFTYESALSGNFRFSVAQNTNTNVAGQIYKVPDFEPDEGLYFLNVNAYLPLGRLHYQAITLDKADALGNFKIELTKLPNLAAVYNEFYCGVLSPTACTVNTAVPIGSQTNPTTCTPTTATCDPAYYTQTSALWPTADARSIGSFNLTEKVVQSPNVATHGFVRWGDTSIPAPAATAVNNGIFFKTAANGVVNIGTAEMSGLAFQHLSILSLGAAP